MSIKEQFDSISEKYDAQRKQLLPCIDDFYALPLTMLDFQGEAPNVLDIGGGTGLFSSFLLKIYPKAKITLIDLSEKMLEVAQKRFQEHRNFTYLAADYTTCTFDEKFDVILSSLSIHHLSASDKASLYKKCYGWLHAEGAFINADQVLSPSSAIEAKFSSLWKESVENSTLSHEEIERAYERIQFDRPSTLAEQLAWLEQAGFQDIDVIYKYYHFCVMYAKKHKG